MQNKQEDLSPEAQRIRRSIYQGLSTVFSDSEADAALKSWSMYASESGSVFNGINAFARDICQSFGKPERQRDLVKALNRALIIKDNSAAPIKEVIVEAAPEPEPEVIEEQSPPEEFMATGQIIITPEFQSFQMLMNKVFEQLDKNRKETVKSSKSFLMEVIEGMPWSETQQQQIISILETGTAVQRRVYKGDQLRTFFKHFRSWLADEFGDAIAEELINRASAEAEDTPEGKKYTTKSFI